jgi:GT2 family glycosyltransferase
VADVAVVIPTVDRVALLDRCLSGVAAQEGDVDYEVVVVHDGDRGVEALLAPWAEKLPSLRVVRIAEREAGVKRNAGWRATDAPWIAFTDDDCEPAPGWLAAAMAASGSGSDDGVELVQGPVRPHPADDHVTGLFKRTLDVPAATDTYPNANLVYARRALERVGGFDPAVWGGGEDTDLAWRVLESGGRAVWAPDALVWHAVRPATFAQHVRSLWRWSTLALVLRRHPQLRRLLHRRLFWKRSHPSAALAIAGLLVAPFDRRALALCVPLLARRVREAGPRDGVQLAAADVVEVGVMVAGAVRYRVVLL